MRSKKPSHPPTKDVSDPIETEDENVRNDQADIGAGFVMVHQDCTPSPGPSDVDAESYPGKQR